MCPADISQDELSNGFSGPFKCQRLTPWGIEQAIHQARCLAAQTPVIMGRQDDNGLFPASGHHLWAFLQREINDLAEAALRFLQLPSVHHRPINLVRLVVIFRLKA